MGSTDFKLVISEVIKLLTAKSRIIIDQEKVEYPDLSSANLKNKKSVKEPIETINF